MPKRDILPIEHLSGDIQKLLDVLNKEPDLSAILVATSYIDACLGSILERKFIESSISRQLLDGRSGALGTFAARSDICYVLGLIDKSLYKDLIKIAEIRNEVAHHHLALDFNFPSVEKLCGELAYVKSLKDGNSGKPLGLEKHMQGARSQFVMTTVIVSNRLLLTGLGLKREKASV